MDTVDYGNGLQARGFLPRTRVESTRSGSRTENLVSQSSFLKITQNPFRPLIVVFQ